MRIPPKTEEFNFELAKQIRKDILEEIFRAAKIPRIHVLRKVLTPFFSTATKHFSEFIVKFDAQVGEKGFIVSAQKALIELCEQGVFIGQEKIPIKGPLIIASNHPGTYDGFAILSQLPRSDFRLIVSGIPFFKNLPNASKFLIFATHDVSERMNVLRKSIRYLMQGGTLVFFPSGRLDPDPSIFSNADKDLDRWSRSIDVLMNKVPDAKLVLAITSGILSREFINHPITRLFKNDHERRRIMEFLQVIKQMIRKKPVELHPKVTFSNPISFQDINNSSEFSSFEFIHTMAKKLMDYHSKLFYPNLFKKTGL